MEDGACNLFVGVAMMKACSSANLPCNPSCDLCVKLVQALGDQPISRFNLQVTIHIFLPRRSMACAARWRARALSCWRCPSSCSCRPRIWHPARGNWTAAPLIWTAAATRTTAWRLLSFPSSRHKRPWSSEGRSRRRNWSSYRRVGQGAASGHPGWN